MEAYEKQLNEKRRLEAEVITIFKILENLLNKE
jgi:hypothetical protein